MLIPVAVLLPVSVVEKVLLVGVVVLVLIAELLNTGIEAAVDRDSLEIDPLGKRAKDFGSAAVMLALLLAGGTWIAILADALPLTARARGRGLRAPPYTSRREEFQHDASGLLHSNIRSLPLVYRGKVRDSYAVGDDKLLLVTSDRLSAFDVVMNQPIPDKGRVLNAMSNFWFEKLAHIVPNHLTGMVAESVVAPTNVTRCAAARSWPCA